MFQRSNGENGGMFLEPRHSVLGKSQGLRPWGKGSATKCLIQPQMLWWLQEEYRVEEEDILENEKQTNKKQHPPTK